LSGQYKGVRNVFKQYWSVYGGAGAVLKSPYFHASLVCGFIAVVSPEYGKSIQFWEPAISILPNLLGFTLGGYAILLAFGDSEFHAMLCGKDEEEGGKESPFVSFAAMYMHFLVIQVVVLIVALLAKCSGLNGVLINLIGFVGLFYALFTGLAAIAGIFKQVTRFDKFVENKKKHSKHKKYL
jgi:hypothetical protein